MQKGQGALEYLIIIAAVLAISAVVVLFVTGAFGVNKSTADFSKCKNEAAQCKSSHLLSPKDPCIICDTACVDSSGNDIVTGLPKDRSNTESAIYSCSKGKPNQIYERAPPQPTQEQNSPQSEANVKAARLAELTDQLIEKGQEYKITSADQRGVILNDINNIAIERKTLAVDIVQTAPEKFLESALDPNNQAYLSSILPADTKDAIEKDTTVSGELTVIPIHDEQTLYSLDNYQVHFAENKEPNLLSGSQITATGAALGQLLIVGYPTNTDEVATYGYTTTTSATTSTIDDQKILVVMVDFDDVSQTYTKPELDSLIFSGADSLNSFYKTVSFNKISFSGDIVGPYKISVKNGDFNCKDIAWLIRNWGLLVDTVIANAGISITPYNRIIYIMPKMKCKTNFDFDPIQEFIGGFGTWGGNPSMSWIIGKVDAPRSIEIIDHEMGHNLGVNHANKIYCGTGPTKADSAAGKDNWGFEKSIDKDENCIKVEYGSSYSIMGSSRSPSIGWNAPHKVAVGWIPSNNIKNVAESGEYTLYPLETTGNNIQVIKIKKDSVFVDGTYGHKGPYNIKESSYFLEYRQPIGVDSTLLDAEANVHINIMSEYSYNGATVYSDTATYLIDTNPGNGYSHGDEALTDGRNFYDQINDVEISQISHDSTKATVRITFQASAVRKVAPTVSISSDPTNPLYSGQKITLTASASDNRGLTKIDLYYDGVVVNSCTLTGTDGTCSYYVGSTAPNRDHKYYAKAYDSDGNSATSNTDSFFLYRSGVGDATQ